jgi:hypothetical protein
MNITCKLCGAVATIQPSVHVIAEQRVAENYRKLTMTLVRHMEMAHLEIYAGQLTSGKMLEGLLVLSNATCSDPDFKTGLKKVHAMLAKVFEALRFEEDAEAIPATPGLVV